MYGSPRRLNCLRQIRGVDSLFPPYGDPAPFVSGPPASQAEKAVWEGAQRPMAVASGASSTSAVGRTGRAPDSLALYARLRSLRLARRIPEVRRHPVRQGVTGQGRGPRLATQERSAGIEPLNAFWSSSAICRLETLPSYGRDRTRQIVAAEDQVVQPGPVE